MRTLVLVRPEAGRFRDARLQFSFDAFMRNAVLLDGFMISSLLSRHKFQILGIGGRGEEFNG
jgi:hypothetical protein